MDLEGVNRNLVLVQNGHNDIFYLRISCKHAVDSLFEMIVIFFLYLIF